MTDYKASKRIVGTSSERTGLLVSVASSGTTTGGLGGASGTISKVGAKLDDSSYTHIGQTIKQVKFRLKKNNSPTGNGSCEVYASSDANMTGTPKATSSSTVDWATLPSSNPTAGTFSATFDFSGFTLADGDRIVITGGSYSNSNEVQALRDSSATDSSWKTAFGYNNGNSTYVSTDTMNIELYTSTGITNAQTNSIFEESDTGKHFLWTGSAWTEVA